MKTETPVGCVDSETPEGEVFCQESIEEVEEGELLVGDPEEEPRAPTPPTAEGEVEETGGAEEEVRRDVESLKSSEGCKTGSGGEGKEESVSPNLEIIGEKEVVEEKKKNEEEEEEENKSNTTQEEPEMKSKNNAERENTQEEAQTLEKSDEKSE